MRKIDQRPTQAHTGVKTWLNLELL